VSEAEDLLWRLAESDEVEIETRDSPRSTPHRTTLWIVTTPDGVFIRSYKGKRGQWYQRVLENPRVAIRVGRRKVDARVVPESHAAVLRRVTAAYREKYGERWSEETDAMIKPSVVRTTLRVLPVSARR
jgi:hypothetical protein